MAWTRNLSVLLGALASFLPATVVAADTSSVVREPLAQAGTAPSEARASTNVLATTTAPPWVPSETVHSERAWEKTVRFPLRVATFPLRLVGEGLEAALGYVEGSALLPRTTELHRGFIRAGLDFSPASLGDRTGLGARAVYRPWGLGRVFGVEVSGTLNKYNRTRLDLTYGPAQIAYQYDWRPRERLFGYGIAISDAEPSTYAVREQSYRVALGYPWRVPVRDRLREQIRVWAGPREARLLRGREAPSFETVHEEIASRYGERQEHLRWGVGGLIDRRYGRPHWTHGAALAVEFERFQDQTSKTLAIRTPRGDSPDFFRTTVEAEAGWSFGRDPRTLRLGIRVVDQGDEATVDRLLPSDLSTLGGSQGLAGFEPGRFRDVDLAVAKLSYIFSLLNNLEFEMHAETGGVYPRLADLDVSTFESSYGIAFRPRRRESVIGSIGADWSRETVRIRFTLGAVE